MYTTNVRRFAISFPVVTAFAAAALLVLTPAVSQAQEPGYGAPQYSNNGPQNPQDQQADPPSRVGRVSVMQGNVSYQPVNVQDFSAAELNYPLTNGDRLYTDNGARAEIEAGQLAIRLGQATDLTVTALSDDYAQFGLAQGSVHLRAYALDPSTTTEVDTPNASITLVQPGDVRIDTFPQDNITIISVISGQVQVNGDNVQQTLRGGQSLRISNSSADLTRRPRLDDLDSFSGQRDAYYQRAYSSEGSYVNPDTIGAGDLAAYGDWSNSPDYGAVWYPRSVDADWAPYSTGRWVSVAPWGWTWVDAEPWGFAPFHYGRWNRFGNRWGWIPGPPVIRPVYSPALVVFVGGGRTFGGGGFSLTIGGGSVAAWFPLGPREVYRPWYRSSPVYVNRVNVTNIYNRNPTEVRNIYNDRRDRYGDNREANYVNRSVATIAVPERNFGSGRPVRESLVRVDQKQMQNAPIMNRPPVEPAQRVAGPRAAPTAIPQRASRPTFESRNPNAPRGGREGFNGGAPNNGAVPNNGGAPNGGRATQVPAGNQPNRGNGNNVAPGQPADTRGNDNRGNDNRFNNGRTQPGQPAPAAPVAQPSQPGAVAPVQPGRNGNNGRGNDGRFNNGAAPVTQPTPAAPVAQPSQPGTAAPAQPDRGNNGRGNNGRFNNGTAPPTAPAPAAPVAQPPAATQPAPARNNGNPDGFNGVRNDGRFGRPAQPAPAAPAQQPAPVAQPAAPAQNDGARPGPQRRAPDAPVQMNAPFNQQPRQPQQQPQQQRQQEAAPAVPVQPRPIEQHPAAAPAPQPRVEQPRQAEQPRPQPAPQQAAPQAQPQRQERPAQQQARPQQGPPPRPQPAKPEEKKPDEKK